MIIDGKKIAEEIITELKKLPKPQKYCAVILVGENPASLSFIKQKEKVAKELGVDFRLYQFPENSTQDFLRKEVGNIAKHKTCGGVIVQLPLPAHINKYYVLNAIPTEKDVDVLSERALGAFYTGRSLVLPPAIGVVEKILRIMNYELRIMNVTIVGLGFLVGKPIAMWLMGQCKEIMLFDEGSDIEQGLKSADIIISGVGKAGLIKPEMLKDGATIIDFGCSFIEGKLFGDFDSLIHNSQFIIHYTPTTGGTGPILVAQLFENFYTLNKKHS